MARGGLSYGGIGAKNVTFKAHSDLVTAAASDSVIGLPVVMTSVSNVVNIGTAGDVPFGFIDVYEQAKNETGAHVGVQIRGFREGVAAGASDIVGKVCVLDGTSQKKVNGATNVGIKQKMTKKVTAGAVTKLGNITITVKAAGKAELVDGKAITVAVAHNDTGAQVATKIKTALITDAAVGAATGFFTVTVDSADTAVVVLEAKEAVANDATMAITFADTGGTGVEMGDTTTVAGLPDKKLGVPIIINTETVGSNHFATVFLG